jgi:hypothetical protein
LWAVLADLIAVQIELSEQYVQNARNMTIYADLVAALFVTKPSICDAKSAKSDLLRSVL